MKKPIPLLLALLCCLCSAASPEAFKQALAPRDWSFPKDHGRHDGFKLEWWYFTGNLQDDSGRKFGYQLTFFRTAFSPQSPLRQSPWAMTDIYFAHAAISDIKTQTFCYKDRLERARPGLAYSSDQTMDVALLDWSAKLQNNAIQLKATESNFAIDLTCADGRGPIFQGPGGVNTKGHQPGQASYYYSITRLKTTGTLTLAGKPYRLTGLTWMDHEFSSDAMSKNQVGWDWMGLQLTDGSDLMLYRMRDAAGNSDYLSGTRITPDAQPHYLSAADLTLSGDSPWHSPASQANYPQRWTVTLKGQPPLTITSEMPAQELITTNSTKVTYFEGAAAVTNTGGHPAGEGYLEMTGYAK
jgi:predicted secreted hydrolase